MSWFCLNYEGTQVHGVLYSIDFHEKWCAATIAARHAFWTSFQRCAVEKGFLSIDFFHIIMIITENLFKMLFVQPFCASSVAYIAPCHGVHGEELKRVQPNICNVHLKLWWLCENEWKNRNRFSESSSDKKKKEGEKNGKKWKKVLYKSVIK